MGQIYNRKTKLLYEDVQYKQNAMNFLYNTVPGRICLRLVICPTLSKIYGLYMKTPISKIHIKPFIEHNHIDMSRYEDRDFISFNDFFTRRLKNLNIESDSRRMVSPADSKLLVYSINNDLTIKVKHGIYTIPELIGHDDAEAMHSYEGGHCLIFRLAVDDYHRYHFPIDGRMLRKEFIKGRLHTISSFSEKYKAFCRNSRVCNYIETAAGNMTIIEVGAMFVGKIVNKECVEFKKGQEKGWFEPGGSTIVILTGPNIDVDKDIIENSSNGIETKVECGEGIASVR